MELIQRLLSQPKDFSFNELDNLLKSFGYIEIKRGKTGGSRRAYSHTESEHVIRLHKPHKKEILKMYQVKNLIEELSKQELL